MEIRDPVHGSIHILDEEIPIIQHDFFQRLRGIKQLGFSDFVFPGATHSRFIHSIGVMSIGEKAFNRLFRGRTHNPDILRLKETFKLACLLHDIGHAPLSHSTEIMMPKVSDLEIPKGFIRPQDTADRQASHEDYTIKAIADSTFAHSFEKVEASFNVVRARIADLIFGQTKNPDYFTLEGINYFPILHQLVSSEMDCDRMDYLLRDSYFCGVSYGSFDLDWLLDNLSLCFEDNHAFLGISERAVITFDDFLLSRYHMFVMVYFHYRSVCLEQLLHRYFKSGPQEYTIPADIEEYIEHDDHYLWKIMKKSKNPYAQGVVKNKIPQKIFESFNSEQLKKLEIIQGILEESSADYIRCSSQGRLSKYYPNIKEFEKYPMKVVRSYFGSDKKTYSNIEEATDLFLKFSKAHSINRLHCDLNLVPKEVKRNIMDIIQN